MSDFQKVKKDICYQCNSFYGCCSCFDCTDFESCERYGTLTHGCSPCWRFTATATFTAENQSCRDELTAHFWGPFK